MAENGNSRNSSEISTQDFLNIVFQNKWVIMTLIVISCLGGWAFNTFSTKQYSSYASFLSTDTDPDPLGGYSSILGRRSAKSSENYIYAVINSERLRQYIVDSFQPTDKEAENKIRNELRLNKYLKLTEDKNNLFTLSFRNKDPQVTQSVIQLTLQFMDQMNTEFQISNTKNLIQIIDTPKRPESPTFPKKKLVYMISVLLGCCLSGIYIIIRALN